MNRYQNNPFRVLGLPPNAVGREVLAKANEIKVKSSVGMSVSFDYDFPWMGPVDRSEENINNAVQRLENPVSRFREEIFWFWFDTDLDREAIGLLIKGDKKGANSCWKVDNLSAKHNRLILAHSVVIGLEASIVYDNGKKIIQCALCGRECAAGNYVYCLECGGQLIAVPKKGFKTLSDTHWKNWDFVMDQVVFFNESLDYWTAIQGKARNIADARLNDGKVDSVKERFVGDLLSANFSLIKNALAVKDLKRVKAHSALISKRNFPVETLRGALNDVLKTRISQIREAASKYSKILSEGEISNQKDLYSLSNELIAETAEALLVCDAIDWNSISEAGLVKDKLAKTIRSISIELNNKFDDYDHAVALLNKAIGIVSSEYIKHGFVEDKKVLEGNAKKHVQEKEQKEIIDPIMKDFENGHSEKAFAALNEYIYNKKISDRLKEVLREIKKGLQEKIVKHGKPIKSAPGLNTVNGMGMTIYGDTLYFVVLAIPIVPIRRYSLENIGNGRYRFFGELELHNWQKWWQWILGIGSTLLVIKGCSGS